MRSSSARFWPGVRTLALGAAAMASATACVEVDGGAVELSWDLRSPDGDPASCNLRQDSPRVDFPDVTGVRICWEPAGTGGSSTLDCVPTRSRRFACELEHGITQFEIERGETTIWIEPICEGTERPPSTYEVPPPIVRDIEYGQVTTLGALLIVVPPSGCAPDAETGG